MACGCASAEPCGCGGAKGASAEGAIPAGSAMPVARPGLTGSDTSRTTGAAGRAIVQAGGAAQPRCAGPIRDPGIDGGSAIHSPLTTPLVQAHAEDVPCGKGTDKRILVPQETLPQRRASGAQILEPFGPIEMDDSGNVFFGLAQSMRRSLLDNSLAELLLPESNCKGAKGALGWPPSPGQGISMEQGLLDLHAQLGRIGSSR